MYSKGRENGDGSIRRCVSWCQRKEPGETNNEFLKKNGNGCGENLLPNEGNKQDEM